MGLKGFFFLLAMTICLSCSGISAREFPPLLPGFNLEGGLEIAGNAMDCLNSLYKVRSCSAEMTAYFTNGTVDISQQCCQSINMITHQCWPAMLTTLGFTVDQIYILRGYCDASSSSNAASFSPFPSPFGQPLPAVEGGDEY